MLNIIGKMLVQLREESAMTVEQLATKSGVNAQKITEIESGKSVPSLLTMMKLSRVLSSGVGVLTFDNSFSGSDGDDIVVYRSRFKQGEESRADDHVLDYLVQGRQSIPSSDKRLEPMILSLAPNGKQYDMSLHSGDGEIFLYVLDGSIKLHYSENGVYHLSSGDSVCYSASHSHHLLNAGDTVARVLMVTPDY